MKQIISICVLLFLSSYSNANLGDPYSLTCRHDKTAILSLHIYSEGSLENFATQRAQVNILGHDSYNVQLPSAFLKKLKMQQPATLNLSSQDKSVYLNLSSTQTSDGEVLKGLGAIRTDDINYDNLDCRIILRVN